MSTTEIDVDSSFVEAKRKHKCFQLFLKELGYLAIRNYNIKELSVEEKDFRYWHGIRRSGFWSEFGPHKFYMFFEKADFSEGWFKIRVYGPSLKHAEQIAQKIKEIYGCQVSLTWVDENYWTN